MESEQEESRSFLKALRSKWVILPLVGLALAGVMVLVWPAAQSSRPGAVKIRLMSYTPPNRMAMVMVSNASSGPIMIWGPCQVERKETGSIVVGGSKTPGTFLRGNSGAVPRAGPQQMVFVQLTGTNRGPWRLQIPVSGYGALAKIEGWLRKTAGWAARS